MKIVLEGNATYFGSAIFGGISLSDYFKEKPRENYLFQFIISYRIIATTVKNTQFSLISANKNNHMRRNSAQRTINNQLFQKYTISIFE